MFSFIIGIIAFICAIWVIYDVWAVNRSEGILGKIIWTVLALMFSILTAILYYLFGRK